MGVEPYPLYSHLSHYFSIKPWKTKMVIELSSQQMQILITEISKKILSELKKSNIGDDTKYMTISQVAKLLNKSISSVRRYIRKTNFPPAIKIGGEFRFEKNDVLNWLSNKKNLDKKIFKAL